MAGTERVTHQEKKLTSKLRAAGEIFAAGTALGVMGVMGITLRNHRELTHKSIELHPLLQKFMDFEQRTLGIKDQNIWAAVHRIHHQMTDVSLFPFYKTAHAIKEAEERGLPIPDRFQHLDPFVDSFTREEVETIGNSADKVVRERLGDEYKKPKFKDSEDVSDTLTPKEPMYYYPPYTKKKSFTQDDIVRIFLTDPHSPALVAPKDGKLNGVRGVGTKGTFLYLAGGSDMFYARPDLKPEDLKTGNEDTLNQKKPWREIAAGFALPAAAVLIYRGIKNREVKPKDVGIALAAGIAINGIKAATEIAGGMAVNSLGHAGMLSNSKMVEAVARKEYIMTLNQDGSLSTDTVKAGFAGKVLSYMTLDEVGRQDFHHKYPEAIAYTDKKGAQSWIDAPWGSFTSFLAHSKLPFIKPGEGFDLKAGERRPDMQHEAVDMVQAARVRQHFPKH